jgi:hypothetical protein
MWTDMVLGADTKVSVCGYGYDKEKTFPQTFGLALVPMPDMFAVRWALVPQVSGFLRAGLRCSRPSRAVCLLNLSPKSETHRPKGRHSYEA